jgi:hypothetical protein
MDANDFISNLNKHTLEELAPYEERYVAWSEDGRRILAHAPTLAELHQLIKTRGITDCVIGFVPNPDISFL